VCEPTCVVGIFSPYDYTIETAGVFIEKRTKKAKSDPARNLLPILFL
jgi:hypothetical protein